MPRPFSEDVDCRHYGFWALIEIYWVFPRLSFGIVAYAFTLFLDNLCRNSCKADESEDFFQKLCSFVASGVVSLRYSFSHSTSQRNAATRPWRLLLLLMWSTLDWLSYLVPFPLSLFTLVFIGNIDKVYLEIIRPRKDLASIHKTWGAIQLAKVFGSAGANGNFPDQTDDLWRYSTFSRSNYCSTKFPFLFAPSLRHHVRF